MAKSKFSKEIAETILNYVKAGAYIETAAAGAGISKQTLYTWLRKGAQPGAPRQLRKFSEDMDHALAQDELRDVVRLEKIANGDKKTITCDCGQQHTVSITSRVQLAAITWKLERKHPDRYGGTVRHDVRVRVQGLVEDLLDGVQEHMSKEAYAELIRALPLAMGEQGLAGAEASTGLGSRGLH